MIEKCLQSIYDLHSFSSFVVVVDNGSLDETKSIIRSFVLSHKDKISFHCHLIELDKNYGTTISRNKGFAYVREVYSDMDYICVLDSDTEINNESMIVLTRALSEDEKCGIIGPRMHSEDGTYQVSARSIPTITEKLFKVTPMRKFKQKGEELQRAVPLEGTGSVTVGYLMSACWVMRNETVSKIGFLDEKIFYAPEDVEYCIRCWKCGYKVMFCYDADILHHWQRLSRKKLFSKHNWEHLKGLGYLFVKYRYLFSNKRFENEINQLH